MIASTLKQKSHFDNFNIKKRTREDDIIIFPGSKYEEPHSMICSVTYEDWMHRV